jgi:hypothetical protein
MRLCDTEKDGLERLEESRLRIASICEDVLSIIVGFTPFAKSYPWNFEENPMVGSIQTLR